MKVKLIGDATYKQAMLLKNMIKVLGKLEIPFGQDNFIKSNRDLTKALIKGIHEKIKSLRENKQHFENVLRDEFISKQFASEIISKNIELYKEQFRVLMDSDRITYEGDANDIAGDEY